MLEKIITQAKAKTAQAANLRELQQIKVEFLGKKSVINAAMQELKKLNELERKHQGQQINEARDQILQLINERWKILEEEELIAQFEHESIDLTIPAKSRKRGSIHPITQVLEELLQIFAQFGFSNQTGPCIETDWYNFTALNIGKDHPARQMHDTFYLRGGEVLRTHTSNVQIRVMEHGAPPFRFIAPGRTYRADYDATHTPMFHQIEGVVVDQNLSMGHLKYVVTEFIQLFFMSSNIKVRFRPSYFPFTEPSAEVDICMDNSNKWLEVLGCGMIHPQVLSNVNINTEEYNGFAFGLGLERFAMLKYNIHDLRQCFSSDIRWLRHHGFSAFDIPNLASGLTK